jgi:NADH-quinone oxidoreductase subunit C
MMGVFSRLEFLSLKFPLAQLQVNEAFIEIQVREEDFSMLCSLLKNEAYFLVDSLGCITCIHGIGGNVNKFKLVYSLQSVSFGLRFSVVVLLDKLDSDTVKIDSVSSIWKSADWLEREVYDMYGILFTNHADLRRILMPNDWVGFPLLKNYEVQNSYHGILVQEK